MAALDWETVFDTYVDRLRVLLSPQTWQAIGMDLSKNDFLTMMLLHRRGEVRMSEIADDPAVPLNTATGVVGRLQSKGLVERRTGSQDRRVIVASLSAQGIALFAQGMREGLSIASRVLEGLTDEELTLLAKVVDRLLDVLTSAQPPATRRPVRRIAIE